MAWTITNNHVFRDGNKRTGMITMVLFLLVNDVGLDVTERDLVDIALKIATYRQASPVSI